MKKNIFDLLSILIFVSVLTSCNRNINVNVKIIEEHDSLVKIIEEHDSMVIFPADSSRYKKK